ncbi:HdeD family acid-resistance protein [Mucilaginibacter sp. PPCGB 2223]|uniref:HdeD family acid-resistance protein n=1 Tax=Mucilaginibacter sp. PPCGB 2223 TaxID=1886027 RepID=UPI001111CD24|nr:DUF308 domain-containing protein [Mucilaginibacter sp. PPCGB 2223]
MEITVDRSIRHWWVFVLRGACFFFLAIYLFGSPENALQVMGYLFSLVILFAGLTEIFHAYNDVLSPVRGWYWIIGIVDIILSIVLFSHVGASIIILRIILGLYILFRGISILSFRGSFGRSWWVTIGGLVVFIFGLIVLFNAGFGNMTMVTWTALACLLMGLLNILLGLRMKPKN